MISKGHGVAEFYADVVKNVIVRVSLHTTTRTDNTRPAPHLQRASCVLCWMRLCSQVKHVELKKLVYMYLVHHAVGAATVRVLGGGARL